ncbi:MAG TPA: pyridoxamine 5'-phosphate oxidase family protein [Ktedonobacteraceae bacterium]|nr:pyridoxamine 5'-phosphate oxidase family protein [Ktedonobacteraceae bacterium]
MDDQTRQTINHFLAQYETLVIATEHEGQPYVTRAYYVEKPVAEGDTSLTLYGTFIVTSRKLANLRENARIGLFIGPDQPSSWLEATAHAYAVEDEQVSAMVRDQLGQKSPIAAGFIASVPIVAVEIQVDWLRITNLTASPFYTEVTFDTKHANVEQKV